MKEKRLNEVFDDVSSFGIFTYLETVSDELEKPLPWKDAIESEMLNLEYHGNHSGKKICAPVIDLLLDDGETLTVADKKKLAKIILGKYLDNWQKIFDAYFTIEYNPLENYNKLEEHTGDDTTTETPTDWKTTTTDTPTDWETVTTGELNDNGNQTSSSVYGFNSSSPVPVTSGETKEKSKITSEQKGTFKKETEQTGTNEHKTKYNTKLTVKGNIGVTTSQQMLESELELRKYKYFNQVYNDVDDVLTILIY